MPVMFAKARLVPSLLDPVAALDRHSPGYMKLQCLDLNRVAASLLGVPTGVMHALRPSTFAFASMHLPDLPSIHSWLLRMHPGRDVIHCACLRQVIEESSFTSVCPRTQGFRG